MKDEVIVPALPPTGEIVTPTALYNTQVSLYRNSLAFGGSSSPSMIWSSMIRDDGSAILYYREMEEKDVDVGNALDTLKLSVLKRKHRVTPFDETPQAAEVAAFIEGQLANIPNLHSVLDNLLDAPGYGFSLGELIFDVSMGQASLMDIKDCPQELFLFGNRFTPQIGQLQFLDSPYASEGALVPENKFLIFSYRSRSRNRMGRPLLRTIFWDSWFKRNVQRLWVQYAEKGPGTAVVRYQDSDSAAEKQNAADIAQALITQVAVGVPQNFEYDKELLTIARAMDPAVYEHFYKLMQLNIVRRVLGETLTSFGSEDGRGSQAQGKTHADTLEGRSVEICRAVQAVVNWQLIRPLVLWNFGPKAPIPSWGYDLEEAEDLTARLAIDKGVQSMGVQLADGYIRQRYSIPALDQDDIILSPNSAAGVTIGDTAQPSFSERRGMGHIAQANHDLAEFDRVAAELRGDAVALMQDRVKEVTSALRPGATS